MMFSFSLSQKQHSFETFLSLSTILSDSTKFDFLLPLSIEADNWDDEKQRPRNIYLKEYKAFNNKLNLLKIEITQLVSEENIQDDINFQESVKSIIKKICGGQKNHYRKDTLIGMMKSYISSKKDVIRLSTQRRYIVFIRLLENFEGYLSRRIKLREVDNSLIQSFYRFGEEECYTESTLNRTVHFIKTVLNFCEKKGVRTNMRCLEIPRRTSRKHVIILTEQEIEKIKKTKVPGDLKCSKDWLLISCYTGQRISDFMRFNKSVLLSIKGRLCISFIQCKTQKEILMPLHPEVRQILKKWGNSFPTPMDFKTYNEQIKKIGYLTGLNNRVLVRKKLRFRSREAELEKWEALSSHIGRRSFASNFYGKIPTPLLMQATGHTTEQMFLKYINPVNHTRVIQLGNYFEQIYAKGA